MKQRRRWLKGLWAASGVFGKAVVGTWVLSIAELSLAAVYLAGVINMPVWLDVWMRGYFSSASFTVGFATFCSDLDAGVPWWRMGWHLVMTPVLSFAVQVLQTVTLVCSVATPAKGFHIVAKK